MERKGRVGEKEKGVPWQVFVGVPTERRENSSKARKHLGGIWKIILKGIIFKLDQVVLKLLFLSPPADQPRKGLKHSINLWNIKNKVFSWGRIGGCGSSLLCLRAIALAFQTFEIWEKFQNFFGQTSRLDHFTTLRLYFLHLQKWLALKSWSEDKYLLC